MTNPELPKPIAPEIEQTGRRVIGCAITVHRVLGPGFKEVIYERALCLEMDAQGIRYESEKRILVPYKTWQIPGHKLDLVVEDSVVLELKSVSTIKKVHLRQVVSYLKATDLRLGYLINFNVPILKDGIRRIAR